MFNIYRIWPDILISEADKKSPIQTCFFFFTETHFAIHVDLGLLYYVKELRQPIHLHQCFHLHKFDDLALRGWVDRGKFPHNLVSDPFDAGL